MTAAPPLPLTSGGRPPFGGPPIRTGFDSSPEDDGDPTHKILAESVERLLKTVRHTPPDRLPVLLDLIAQRKKWIEAEVSAERMLMRASLPPAFADSFSLEYLLSPESEILSGYLRLLDWLDESARDIRKRLSEQIGEPGASEV